MPICLTTFFQKINKIVSFFKKVGSKNWIIICAVLLIGAAIGINYIVQNIMLEFGDEEEA